MPSLLLVTSTGSLSTVSDAESNVSCNFTQSSVCGYTKGECWDRMSQRQAFHTYRELSATADVSIIAYFCVSFYWCYAALKTALLTCGGGHAKVVGYDLQMIVM